MKTAELQTTSEQQYSDRVSVPSGEGIRVDKTITIQRPPAVVYSFWRDLENLPCFMRHLESVSVRDDLHSHWAAKGLGGQIAEWDAEIIERRENEMISWRSIPGSEVENAGSVWFTPVPDGGATIVRVELKYDPPAGKTGDFIAGLFGRDAKTALDEDLGRLKSLLETGELPEQERGASWPQKAAEAFQKAARATDQCVREKPWSAILATGAACLAAGLLLGCRVFGGRRKADRTES